MQQNGKKNKNSIAQLKDTLCVYQYRVLDQKTSTDASTRFITHHLD